MVQALLEVKATHEQHVGRVAHLGMRATEVSYCRKLLELMWEDAIGNGACRASQVQWLNQPGFVGIQTMKECCMIEHASLAQCHGDPLLHLLLRQRPWIEHSVGCDHVGLAVF